MMSDERLENFIWAQVAHMEIYSRAWLKQKTGVGDKQWERVCARVEEAMRQAEYFLVHE